MSFACLVPAPLTAPQTLKLRATIQECSEIARQLRVACVHSAEADMRIVSKKTHISCKGSLRAQWTDNCVLSNIPMELKISESLDLKLVWDRSEETLAPDEDWVQRDATGHLDLGALLIEYISLHMPDYPHLIEHQLSEEAQNPTSDTSSTRPFADLGQLLEQKSNDPKFD